MNLFLWDSYSENEITEKTKYWVDLWEKIIEDFSEYSYERELVNPHLLLNNLIDEVKYNNLKNKENNNYLIKKFNDYVTNDPVIKKSLKNDFILIINELKNSKRFEYFILLCEQTKEYFQKGTYFKESCDVLKQIILNSEWKENEEEAISQISQSLIIELILEGYSIEKIKTIPENLFDKYEIRKLNSKEFVQTKYPSSLNLKMFYECDIFNQNSYNEALKTEIDSLTISDRINRLKYYFDKEPDEGYGIFHVEGLKKQSIDINIGEVNFYSPNPKDLIKSKTESETKVKDFSEKKLEFYDREKQYSVNAAVKIKYRDFESAKIQALEIIETSLDLLRLYVNSETPFKVAVDKFYLVDCEDLSVLQSYSAKNQKFYKEINSCDLSGSNIRESLNDFKELLSNSNIKKSPLSVKLIYSLHWYRKAFETSVIEDKLLNYWIVIENLITFDSKNGNLVLRDGDVRSKFVLVEELVPFIELRHSIYSVVVDTYIYLYNLINHSQTNSKGLSKKCLDIPEDCIDACKLRGQIFHKDDWKEFILNLHLLCPHIKNKVIENKIKYTEKFYNDTKFTSSELQTKLNQTKQDLLLIYRYRNLIVHNARFDNNILPYYVTKAEHLARNLLLEILSQHIKNYTRSQQEILIGEKVKMDRIIKKLESNEPVDLWEL